jgi:hypothetical protein
MEYYAILILVAVVILIGSLAFIGVKMSTTQSIAPYPPVAYACPDYWSTDSAGACIAGNVNLGALYSGYTIDPSTISYTGLTPMCAKQRWANTNNIVWTGVSEYNQC